MRSAQAFHNAACSASRGYPEPASSMISMAESHSHYRWDKIYHLWKAEINSMYLMAKISLSAYLHLKNRHGEYSKSAAAKAWGFLLQDSSFLFWKKRQCVLQRLCSTASHGLTHLYPSFAWLSHRKTCSFNSSQSYKCDYFGNVPLQLVLKNANFM